MNIQTVKLEKLRMGLEMRLSDKLLCDAQVSIIHDYITNHVILLVKGHVWGELESVQRREISYPRDWWESFKERWFPDWVLSKWPVVYTKVIIDVRAIYPNFRPAMPYDDMVLILQDGCRE